jgi:hypothetical protein
MFMSVFNSANFSTSTEMSEGVEIPNPYRRIISLIFYCHNILYNSGCAFDHSAAGQERCIQSFSLLTKRELQQHAQLEPWSRPTHPANAGKATNTYGSKHAGPSNSFGPARPYAQSTSTRLYQKLDFARPSFAHMQIEDHLADQNDYPPPSVFDPDNVLTQALLNQLASATSASSQLLCQPFVRSVTIVTDTQPISFNRGLLDTGAQGSNFISRQLYESLPSTITEHSRSIDRVVRLGYARSLSIQLEVLLTVNILDSTDNIHQHTLWYPQP